MTTPMDSAEAGLRAQIAELRTQLDEANETLDAIRNGEVDAVVVGGPDNRQIYTLESADRQYRMLIEQMDDGAVMLSAEGVVLYCNPALALMLGAQPSELVGSRFTPFVAASSVPAFESLLEGSGRTEMQLRRLDDDQSFTVQFSVTRLTSGDGAMLCGVVTDLTRPLAAARDVAEARSRLAVSAARHESDERYRLILESATDYAIFAVGLDRRVTIWNTGATNVLGWTPEETIGRAMPPIWTPDDVAADAPEREFSGALEDGRAEDERWHVRKDGSRFWATGLMMPLRDAEGAVIGFMKILRDRTAQRRAEENQRTLINELNHRVKNTLAIVQSIATNTLRDAPTPRAARAALDDRLIALSKAHDVLTRESWEGAELGEIVGQALEPYQTDGRTRIQAGGPSVRVTPRLALAIAMALQELATNAVKYGALSSPDGRLTIDWTVSGPALRLVWRESDGPPVTPPTRRGFGSRLIERSLAADFRGASKIAFDPTGVVCVIEADMTAADPD